MLGAQAVVARAMSRTAVEKAGDRGIDQSLVRERAQKTELPASRLGAARRHVRRLIPDEDFLRIVKILDRPEALLEARKIGVNTHW